MKKLMMLLLLAGVVSAASAQHGRVMVRPAYRPHTTVVIGGGFYSPYYSPYGFYGYPYYGFAPSVQPAPSKLDQEIADINHDYSEKIESARMDNSLTGKARRQQIRALKHERDQAIDDAKRDYYRQ